MLEHVKEYMRDKFRYVVAACLSRLLAVKFALLRVINCIVHVGKECHRETIGNV